MARGKANESRDLPQKLADASRVFRQSFGERLTIVLDAFDSRAEAAAVAGVVPEQLAKYVRGGAKPTLEVMARLCDTKGFSLDWLWTGEGGHRDTTDATETVMVPFRDVRAGAGAAQLANGEAPKEFVPMGRAFLVALGVKPSAAEIVIADGPSMKETIDHGDPMVIDTSETEARDAIFVMRREGGVLVKRLQRRSDGSLMLIADNPAFPPELLPRDDAEDIHLIGRVKFVFRRL